MIKDFINELLTKIRVSDNAPFKTRIALLENINENLIYKNNGLNSEVEVLEGENDSLNSTLAAERKKMEALLTSDNLDINSLRSWYEGRREQRAWLYDGKRLGEVDVKLYLKIKNEDKNQMFEAAQIIIDKYKLTKNSKPEIIIGSIMKYFISRNQWKYVYDKDKHGQSELWQYAVNSWKERTGDCDDLAILMHVLWDFILRKLVLNHFYWRLTFTAGTLLGEGGHAFNTYLHNDGNYYCVESTYGLSSSYRKTWLETRIKNNNLYVNFWGFATKDKSWVGSTSALKRYKNEML